VRSCMRATRGGWGSFMRTGGYLRRLKQLEPAVALISECLCVFSPKAGPNDSLILKCLNDRNERLSRNSNTHPKLVEKV
jgi:hypothetical protein